MTTRRLAVLGLPIEHSLSPLLHRTAYATLGLPWEYDAVPVDAAGLAHFMDSLGSEWLGLSLTMPLKEAVLPLLTSATVTVRSALAANTVVLGHGERHGHNTDVPAMQELLGDVAGATLLVLGAGATARSTLVAAATAGCRRVVVVARRSDERLTELAGRVGLELEHRELSDLAPAIAEGHLTVSTLPGAVTAALAPGLAPVAPLIDVAYDPWPTPLAVAFEQARQPVTSGIELLVRQAALQVELFTGRPAPVAAMRAAVAHRQGGSARSSG